MLDRNDLGCSPERNGNITIIHATEYILQGIGRNSEGVFLVHFKIPVSENESRTLKGSKSITLGNTFIIQSYAGTAFHSLHRSAETETDSTVNRLIQRNNLAIVTCGIDIYARTSHKHRTCLNNRNEVEVICVNSNTTI